MFGVLERLWDFALSIRRNKSEPEISDPNRGLKEFEIKYDAALDPAKITIEEDCMDVSVRFSNAPEFLRKYVTSLAEEIEESTGGEAGYNPGSNSFTYDSVLTLRGDGRTFSGNEVIDISELAQSLREAFAELETLSIEDWGEIEEGQKQREKAHERQNKSRREAYEKEKLEGPKFTFIKLSLAKVIGEAIPKTIFEENGTTAMEVATAAFASLEASLAKKQKERRISPINETRLMQGEVRATASEITEAVEPVLADKLKLGAEQAGEKIGFLKQIASSVGRSSGLG